MAAGQRPAAPDLQLPLTLLLRYLFFLSRRPVSASNSEFLNRRIAGLRSLVGLLRNRDDRELEQVAEQLDELTPANLFRLGPAIRGLVKDRLREELPRDVLLRQSPPPPRFWSGVRRICVLFGAAIGIGDEVICFPIPACLRRLAPQAHITVSSAYTGLWSGVSGPDSATHYASLRELAAELRAGSAAHDLILLVDFESPGLIAAMCEEPAIDRYGELSLGGRTLSLLDARSREIYQMSGQMSGQMIGMDAYCTGYYACLDRMMAWMGVTGQLPERRKLVTRPAKDTPAREFTILVSPFTSKGDPAERYWSSLLTNLVPAELPGRVRIAIDTGATPASESFAMALCRSIRRQEHPDVRCQVMRSEVGRSVPVAEFLMQLGSADMVITADSFPAHAAALFDCLTVVIAGRGLENWRAPIRRGFYLPGEAPAALARGAIRELLGEYGAEPSSRPARFGPADTRELERLIQAAAEVSDGLACAAGWMVLITTWNEFAVALSAAAASLDGWPAHFDLLFADREYLSLFTPVTWPDSAETRQHLAARWDEWKRSNLRSYLELKQRAGGLA